jgi:hypothetical protein
MRSSKARSFLLLQILSGASNGFNTGMPKQDIVLATAVATAVATATMGENTCSMFGYTGILQECQHFLRRSWLLCNQPSGLCKVPEHLLLLCCA